MFFYLIRTVGKFFFWLFVSLANILGERGGGDKRKIKTKTAEREAQARERDAFMN